MESGKTTKLIKSFLYLGTVNVKSFSHQPFP